MNNDFDNYLSPFTWRYASDGMRRLWSESSKRRLWRQVWITLAETQAEFGLVTPEQVEDLRAHEGDIDITQALEIEAEIGHDLMAELKVFAGQARIGGVILHLGATSTDIEDNADALRIIQSLELVLERLKAVLLKLTGLVDTWAEAPAMAFTHLQPAEPTTLGYRLSIYAQDLFMDWQEIRHVREHLRGKGFKGAVGTRASYGDLIGAENLADFEARLSQRLNLDFFPVAAQTYPRKQDFLLLSALAGLGASIYKFAFDLRFLQSPQVGELSEPFGKLQVGSSAMPFKRNPVNAEKLNSLARALAQSPRVAWDNAAHSLLERTLDDSGNRRSLLPEAFLIADELLITINRIVEGLVIDEHAIARNLDSYGSFAASERVLMALVKAGADRQEMHERLRQLAMQAWEEVRTGRLNPFVDMVCKDEVLHGYIAQDRLRSMMETAHYVGDAPERARLMAEWIRQALSEQGYKE